MKDPYFTIELVIDLLREQEPDRLELIEQLRELTVKKWARQPYISIVNPEKPNHPGSEW